MLKIRWKTLALCSHMNEKSCQTWPCSTSSGVRPNNPVKPPPVALSAASWTSHTTALAISSIFSIGVIGERRW